MGEKGRKRERERERERERKRVCHFHSPGASDDTRTRTLDLVTTRQVSYYCATATGLLGCFLKNAVFFRQSSIGQLIQIEVTKVIELSDEFDEGTNTNGVNILRS